MKNDNEHKNYTCKDCNYCKKVMGSFDTYDYHCTYYANYPDCSGNNYKICELFEKKGGK